MKHHQYNPNYKFVKEPIEFDKNSDRNILQYCLGATLYMPGTKKILDKILNKEMSDITSMVMCFEDAIQEKDLEKAEINVLEHLEKLADTIADNKILLGDIPLIFLRVRNVNQFETFVQKLTNKHIRVLSGFVFPKFYSDNAVEYLKILEKTSLNHNVHLYCMPILEGKTIAYLETRKKELFNLKQSISKYKDYILNIRVGGTDFSALFGVRRGINSSIYDILTVRDTLSDILNFFNRSEDDYIVSAPVWEYFLAYKKDDLKDLVNDNIHKSLVYKSSIINDAIDGLLREVILDKANGFIGKTIIHPSHAKFVNAMQAVTKEEYDDAMQILGDEGGVIKSANTNKMNERKPHRSWALRIENRANVFGVVKNESDFIKLILS